MLHVRKLRGKQLHTTGYEILHKKFQTEEKGGQNAVRDKRYGLGTVLASAECHTLPYHILITVQFDTWD